MKTLHHIPTESEIYIFLVTQESDLFVVVSQSEVGLFDVYEHYLMYYS